MAIPNAPELAAVPVRTATRLAEQWWKLKMADTGVQIAKDQHRQSLIGRLIRKTQDGTLGKPTVEPEDVPENADMGVRIGDEIHYPAPQVQPTTSPWAKAAIGAAIGFATAGPLGAAFALPSILEALRPAPPAQVAPATPAVVPAPAPQALPVVPHVPVATPVRPDTETIFEIRLGDPKPPTKD